MNSATALDRRDGVDMTAAALMLLLTLSWGMNGVAAKISYAGFDPVLISVLRALIGGALVLAWCRWRGISVFDRDGSLWPGMLAGLLFGLEFLVLYIGLDHTTVAHNTLLVNTMPFWVLIGGHFLLGEHFTTRKLLGLALAFGGLITIFWEQLASAEGDTLRGDMLSLSGGILWALTYLVIKRSRALTYGSAEKLLLYQLAGAALVGAAALPFVDQPVRAWALAPTLSLLFQSAYIVAITYVLWFWLIRRYPAAELASFTFLTPAFGVLSGALVLSEPLTARVFLALALIAAGLIVVNRPQKSAARIGAA